MAETDIDRYLAQLEQLERQDEREEAPEITPEKLGYALRQEQKTRKSLEKELKDLREFAEAQKAKERVVALQAAGLDDFHAEAFTKFYPEVSEENLAAYKVRAHLEAPTSETREEVEESAPEASPRGFTPLSVPATSGTSEWSRGDWLKLVDKDPARAEKLFNEGKVDMSDLRKGLGPDIR